MKKYYFLLSTLIFSFLNFQAQEFHRCGTNEHLFHLNQQNPGHAERVNQALEEIAAASNLRNGDEELYRIPVVVHIIYNNEANNLPDSVIFNQINILNQDFRRLNPDTSVTRDIFKSRAADTRIEFYLAGIDPDGNPSNGITRTQSNSNFALSVVTNNIKQTASGGKDAWPTNKYMNIWVGDLSIFGAPVILGYATPPEGAPNWPDGSSASQPQFDGVVVHNQVFGSNNPNTPPSLSAVGKGRTTTHEVGHYLGLRHIWGDGGGFGGGDGCTVDDGIEDTPNAAAASQQTCDYSSNSCVDSPIDYPDMIENYMDYSDEACMNMFTQGQMNAMRFCLEQFRQELIDTTNAPIGISNLQGTLNVKLYPNPAQNFVNIETKTLNGLGSIAFHNLSGAVIKQQILNFSENSNIQLDISDLPAGIYFTKIFAGGKLFHHKILKNR
jgi:hypothetical protein